jgi:uncharacterized membrane protein
MYSSSDYPEGSDEIKILRSVLITMDSNYICVSIYIVRFEVFTAVTMKNGVFWVVTWYFFAAYVGC